MGYYLNPEDITELYRGETQKPYFVDKTKMLAEMIVLLEQGRSYISVTRPRRFGKSMVASMIGSFFGKGADSTGVFSHLKIAGQDGYEKHMNQHNLIYIDFSRDASECDSYIEYIHTFNKRLLNDIKEAWPDVKIREKDSIGMALRLVSLAHKNEKFLMIFDEWDYVFHKDHFTESDRRKFMTFLGDMMKDKTCVEMAYLTGVLPIKKYSASDTMNHFAEFNMANSDMYSEYFGFTEEEVDELYQRYLKNCDRSAFSREDLADWYDGYRTDEGDSIYNPNSVVFALTQNKIKNYWISTGKYNELKEYIVNDIDGVRDTVMLLAAGEPVEADISEYATSAPALEKRDEILSAMVVYGYLNYYDGCVRIPNKELETEFDRIIRTEPKYA